MDAKNREAGAVNTQTTTTDVEQEIRVTGSSESTDLAPERENIVQIQHLMMPSSPQTCHTLESVQDLFISTILFPCERTADRASSFQKAEWYYSAWQVGLLKDTEDPMIRHQIAFLFSNLQPVVLIALKETIKVHDFTGMTPLVRAGVCYNWLDFSKGVKDQLSALEARRLNPETFR